MCCGENAARLEVTTIRQGQVQESSEGSEALGGCCWAGEGKLHDVVQVATVEGRVRERLAWHICHEAWNGFCQGHVVECYLDSQEGEATFQISKRMYYSKCITPLC